MPKGFFAAATLAQSAVPTATVPLCGACGLYRGCHSPKMPVTGKGRRGILVVGEAPGKEEDLRNTQLIGPSGQLLRTAMAQSGVDLDRDCWKTNSLICRPPNNKIPAPESNYIGYCRPNLTKTIKDLAPEVVILLGGHAVESAIGPVYGEVGGVGRWVGDRIPSRSPNAWLCPVWHPAHVLRAGSVPMRYWWHRHVAAALALRGRPWTDAQAAEDFTLRVRPVLDVGDAATRIDTMAGLGCPVAFDYETNMLKPDSPDARIISVAVSNGKTAIAAPWHGPVITQMGALLRSTVPKYAANLKFEDRWTRAVLGHPVRAWGWDTMQAAHVIDNRPDITGLKFQTYVNFGCPPYDKHIKAQLQAKVGVTAVNRALSEIDLKDLLTYNGLDALFEYMLAKVQMERLGWTSPSLKSS